MADVVHEFKKPIHKYKVRAFAEKHGHLWIGWLEFKSASETLKTGEETSQPTKGAVVYWATGLEPVFLEGALKRAK
jgi:hypothetical protein